VKKYILKIENCFPNNKERPDFLFLVFPLLTLQPVWLVSDQLWL